MMGLLAHAVEALRSSSHRVRWLLSLAWVGVWHGGKASHWASMTHECPGVAPASQTKERSVHELFTGAFWNKSSTCESCLFSKGKTPEFTKMGEIHEVFVLALSLVWFAGATPDMSVQDWLGSQLWLL